MKRLFSFILLLLLVLISASCKNDTASYEIIQTSSMNKAVIIHYPKIKGLVDADKQQAINELIKSEAYKVLNYYSEDLDKLSLEVEYRFKLRNSKLISLEYTGYGNIKGAAHPNNIFYTTNLDIDNVKKLRLSDLVTIDTDFIEKLRKASYKPFDPDLNLEEQAREELNRYSNDDLIRYLKKADSFDQANALNAFSYLTANSLGISIGAPHAMGDHIEFEIKLKDIKENIISPIPLL